MTENGYQPTVQEKMRVRARVCWVVMDRNEKAAVRIGISPAWTIEKDLGEKHITGFSKLDDAESNRELTLALIDLTNTKGKGMIA